ncbi:MAG: helix-turn-helix transcriptional regulator [Bdellovibrionales bacterium]|nr:helix-turn-helix transcriptional regulator [Bdellovibrionales bacterium]
MIPFTTTAKQKVKVYIVAAAMNQAGLSAVFIEKAVSVAIEYEGMFDLMELWLEESDPSDRQGIEADIQDVVDEREEAPPEPLKKPYVRFDDLDKIAKDVKKFKNALRKTVDRWGGISKLAAETGIPQPSLSRFFNSAAMPRRATLYRIAGALKLPERELLSDWVA